MGQAWGFISTWWMEIKGNLIKLKICLPLSLANIEEIYIHYCIPAISFLEGLIASGNGMCCKANITTGLLAFSGKTHDVPEFQFSCSVMSNT